MIRFGLLGCGRIAKRHSDLLGGNHIDRAMLLWLFVTRSIHVRTLSQRSSVFRRTMISTIFSPEGH